MIFYPVLKSYKLLTVLVQLPVSFACHRRPSIIFPGPSSPHSEVPNWGPTISMVRASSSPGPPACSSLCLGPPCSAWFTLIYPLRVSMASPRLPWSLGLMPHPVLLQPLNTEIPGCSAQPRCPNSQTPGPQPLTLLTSLLCSVTLLREEGCCSQLFGCCCDQKT